MSVLTVVVLNAIVAGAVVATLAYVCRISYRLDRVVRPKESRVADELQHANPAYERSAA